MAARSLPILPGSTYLAGAHHPHCDRHANHLLWVSGRPLCLGCACMYTGAALGVAAFVIFSPQRTQPSTWLIIHAAGVGPTFVQPWL